MITLLLARHGETEFNRRDLRQGWEDIRLNSRGVEQAKALARRLAGTPITKIVSSDLLRCRETAGFVAAELKLPVQVRPALREINYGIYQGIPEDELTPDLYAKLAEFRAGKSFHAPPGGESVREVYDRVVQCLAEIIAETRQSRAGSAVEKDTVLVVTHAGPIRLAMCHFLGMPLENWRRISPKNASLTAFAIRGDRVTIEAFNDTMHLMEDAG